MTPYDLGFSMRQWTNPEKLDALVDSASAFTGLSFLRRFPITRTKGKFRGKAFRQA